MSMAANHDPVPFNLRQRAAALRRQVEDMEWRRRKLAEQEERKRRELAEIEQQMGEQEGADR